MITPEQITAYAAAVGAILGPLAIWYWKRLERVDKVRDEAYKRREAHEATLFDRQNEQLERAFRRIKELESAVETAEDDRDRAYQIGWAWYLRANELRHALLTCRLDPKYIVAVPDLPKFNEIIPKGDDPASRSPQAQLDRS